MKLLHFIITIIVINSYLLRVFGQDNQHDADSNAIILKNKKGNIYLGGNFALGVGYRNTNAGFGNAIVLVDIVVNPIIGYHVKEKWLVAFSVNILNSQTFIDQRNRNQINYTAFMSLGRYYTSKNSLFIEASAGYGLGMEANFSDGGDIKQRFAGYNYSLGVGIDNFWSKHIKFNVLVKFSGAAGRNNFSLYGLNVSAGIAYIR